MYLVGGAVRDSMLARPITDLDFTLASHAIQIARRIANHLQAAFYPLDTGRDIGRVIFQSESGKRWTLDFAAFQGKNLEEDLRKRDFTVNAMALQVPVTDTLIDPLGGARDLSNKVLAPCSNHSLTDDPIRIPRAFRLAAELRLKFSSDLVQDIHGAVGLLPGVSQDRLRDEIFRIFSGARPVTVLRGLELVTALRFIFPEVAELKSVSAAPPHTSDAFSHTLDTVQKLHQVLQILSSEYDPEPGTSWILGMISFKLGRYRQQISDYLNTSIVTGRSLAAVLLLSALYHDTGKPATRTVDAAGKTHFYGHESCGAEIAYQRARNFRLSRWECDRIRCTIQNHMRPLLLAHAGGNPSRRSIYRFFNATGEAGVEICLLSLADVLATYGVDLSHEIWLHHLEIVRTLLEAWWDRHAQLVSPPGLINGTELMEEIKIKPGPLIGKTLNLIREKQAAGEINSRQEALELARNYLEKAQAFEMEDSDPVDLDNP